jgi:hypothetical protein
MLCEGVSARPAIIPACGGESVSGEGDDQPISGTGHSRPDWAVRVMSTLTN